MGTINTNGVVKATNMFINNNQVLHTGNWSSYCAAKSHTHDDLIVKETLSSTRESNYSVFLLYTFTTTDTSWDLCAFNVDVIDQEKGITSSFNVLIRCYIDSEKDSSYAQNISSGDQYSAGSKAIFIKRVKDSSSWTYYIYLETVGSWCTSELWFKFTCMAGFIRTWHGTNVTGSETGDLISRSQKRFGNTLPSEYCREGMTFFKII